MRDSLTNRLSWLASRVFGSIGSAGGAGLVLLALAAAFYFLKVDPLHRRVVALAADTEALRTQAGMKAPAPVKAAEPVAQLGEFYRFFPDEDTLPASMKALYEAAAHHGLALEQGEYRLVRDREGKLARYEIALPVKGDYVRVRKFVAEVTSEISNLTLDGISFNRQRAADAAVDTQLRLTLFVRGK